MASGTAPGPWLRLTALSAAGASLLAVVSGAAGPTEAHRLLAALALQLAIAVSMVLETFPLLLATAHTAGAALLLLATLALVRSTTRLR